MSEKFVSVVIPAYNSARFIGDTLQSVFEQNYPVQVIVVNDGSQDNLYNALLPYKSSITLIEQKNKGLSAARNAGIKASEGEYMLFLDADDILGPDVLSKQVQALEKEGRGFVICRTFFFTEQDTDGKPIYAGEWRRYSVGLDVHLCHFNLAPPLACFVRRKAVLDSAGFDESLGACEDHDFWLRMMELGHRPRLGADQHVWYRRHAGSMSSDKIRQCRHDLKMHMRIYRALCIGGQAYHEHMPSKWLACCAGMLLTANRLPKADASLLLTPSLTILKKMLKKNDNKISLYHFFLARCLMLSRRLCEWKAHQDYAASLCLQNGLEALLCMRQCKLEQFLEDWRLSLHFGEDKFFPLDGFNLQVS